MYSGLNLFCKACRCGLAAFFDATDSWIFVFWNGARANLSISRPVHF